MTHVERMTLLSILSVGAARSFNLISNSHCYIKTVSRAAAFLTDRETALAPARGY